MPPPNPPRQNSSGSNDDDPFKDFPLQNLSINAPPPQRKRKKKKLVPLIDKIYFTMFIVGMVIGAFLSLLLPFRNYTVTVSGKEYTIPINITALPLWGRIIVYGLMVIFNGFLWSKLAREICITYFPQTRYIHRAPEEEVEQGQKLYRLDD